MDGPRALAASGEVVWGDLAGWVGRRWVWGDGDEGVASDTLGAGGLTEDRSTEAWERLRGVWEGWGVVRGGESGGPSSELWSEGT